MNSRSWASPHSTTNEAPRPAADLGRAYLAAVRRPFHYNKNRKVPFRIHPDVLTSDEAIVAVFRHEMHELSLLREVFMQSGTESMDGTDHGLQTAEGRPGNFHERAWDEADKIVLRMRRRGR